MSTGHGCCRHQLGGDFRLVRRSFTTGQVLLPSVDSAAVIQVDDFSGDLALSFANSVTINVRREKPFVSLRGISSHLLPVSLPLWAMEGGSRFEFASTVTTARTPPRSRRSDTAWPK